MIELYTLSNINNKCLQVNQWDSQQTTFDKLTIIQKGPLHICIHLQYMIMILDHHMYKAYLSAI